MAAKTTVQGVFKLRMDRTDILMPMRTREEQGDRFGVFLGRTRAEFVVGTAEHFRWLQGIVTAVLLLNVLDAAFTLHWVNSGLAEEANPLLSHIVQRHPVSFVSIKLGLVSLGSWLLWSHRHRHLAVIAIFLAFVVYYSVVAYHLEFLAFVVRSVLQR